MRWRLWGLFFFAMAGAAAWTFWLRPETEVWLKNKIQQDLSRALAQDVHIDSLSIHPLLFRLGAGQVRVGPVERPLFTCSRWTFHTAYAGDATPFSLFSLTLGRSELENPAVYVAVGDGPSAGLNLSGLQKIPLHRLTWSGGELRVQKSSSTIGFIRLSGDLQLTPRSISLTAGGNVDPKRPDRLDSQTLADPQKPSISEPFIGSAEESFRLKVHCSRSLLGPPQMDAQATLDVSNFSLAHASQWIDFRWGAAVGKVKGSLSARWDNLPLDSSPMVPDDFFRKARWTGNMQLDARWTPPLSRRQDRGVPIQGKVAFTNDRLDLIDVHFFQTLSLSGTVKIPSGESHLQWRGEAVPLADLAQSGVRGVRGIPPRGTLDTTGVFSGTKANPHATWTATVRNAGVPGLGIPEFSAQGKWDLRNFFVTVNGWGGVVEMSRRGADTHLPRWWVNAVGLDLGVWAAHNGWRRLGGSVNASFSMGLEDRVGRFPSAEGKLRVDGFSWTGVRATAPVEGLFQMGPGGARVRGAGGNFDVEIADRSGQWRVERFHYVSDGVTLQAQGVVKDSDGKIGLEVRADGFSLAHFPFLTKHFPTMEGRLSVSGRVQGEWGAPLTAGHFSAEGVRWRSGGIPHRAEGQWQGGPSGITLTDGAWDDAVRAEGTWLFGKGGHLNAELHRASADKVFDFLPDTSTVAGQVSGGLSMRVGTDQKINGWARFTVDQGRWKKFSFDHLRTVAFVREDKIDLESLSVRTKEGSFDCRGSVKKKGNVSGLSVPWEWEGSGSMNNFPGRWALVRSSWTARGVWRPTEKEGRGTWASPSVLMEGSTPVDMGEVRLSMSWSPDRFQFEPDLSQRGLTGAVSISRSDGRVTGRFQVKDLSVPALLPSAAGVGSRFDDPPSLVWGPVNGAGTVGGVWPNPTAEGRFVLADSRWKENHFVGEARANWDGSLTVSRANVLFNKGGGIEGSGRWVPGTVSQASLDVRLKETPLAPFLKSWGGAVGHGGTAEGALSLAGPVGALEGTATFIAKGVGGPNQPVDVKGQFRLSGSTATVQEVLFKTPEGFCRLRPGGWVAYQNQGRWAFDWTGDIRNLNGGPFRVFGGAGFSGVYDGRVTTLEGKITADGLWINKQVFDGDLAQFELTPEAIRFETVPGASTFVKGRVLLARWPHLFFENLTLWGSGERKLVMSGDLGPELWDFSLQGRGLEADALLPLADIQWPITGRWDVRLRGRGSYLHPDVSADISGGAGALGPLPYDRINAQAHWNDGAVRVTGLSMVRRKGYTVTGEAKIPVGQKAGLELLELNVRLEEGKATVLEDVWPLCRSARGNFWGELVVKPGKRVPQVTGFVKVQDARLHLYQYAPRVDEINGEIRFQNDRARVEHARARVGKGWIEMAGDVGIRGLEPVEYDLSIQTDGNRGVYVEVPQLSVAPGPLLGRFSFLSEKLKGITYGEPRLSMRVKGRHGQHTLSGSVDLERTRFTYPPMKTDGEDLHGPRWWKNFWRHARWDVTLNTGRDTWYRNEYVDVKLRGRLALAGQPGDWSAHGRVDAEEGMINYLGQLFKVNRGTFELLTETRPGMGETGLQPYLSGEAQRTVTTVDGRGLSTDDTILMVVDRALIKDLQPRFVSRNNPDMKSDRVAMKALGVSGDQPFSQADRDQLLKAGLIQLAGSSAAPAANRLAQKFGIDIISPIYEPPESLEEAPTVASAHKTEPAAGTETISEYLRGAGASARVRLNDRLSGVYKVKLDETKNQTYFRDQIELILRVKGSVYMRASSELDSQYLLGQPPERRLALENIWRFGSRSQVSSSAKDAKK